MVGEQLPQPGAPPDVRQPGHRPAGLGPVVGGDAPLDRDAEGFEISPSIKLIRTPGHSAEDITTLAGTADGVVAFTHVWWTATIPEQDPYAIDAATLSSSRKRVLDIADQVVPGHGPMFVPDETTPR